jgi:EmrB/QacA subfamily drug resistance transporter
VTQQDAQGRHVSPDLSGRGRSGSNGEAPATEDRRRWVALVVVLVAGFMDLLDVTIVNVAIPSILTDLDAEYAEVEWVVAAYVLAFAALLITGGRLGDIYGRKRLFLIGVGGFTIASAVCGVAGDPAVLIGARFFQGAMAGLMVPQILSIIHVTFRPEERGKVFGLWGGILGFASAAGLIIGGLLLDWNVADLGWRPIFLINIPVGLLALLAGWLVVQESRSAHAPKLDLIGVVLAVTGVLMLVYPLLEGRSLGWPAWIFLLMAGAVVLLALCVAYERHRARTVGSPLVVLSLFRARAFSSGMGVWLIFWIALGGFFILWTLYMQVGLGWSPLRAGLTATSFAVGGALGAGMAVEVLTPRFGRRVLMAGALLNAVGFASYSWVASHYGPEIDSWQMVAPLAIAGIGFGLLVAPMVDAILTDVPIPDAGSASGLLNTTQQVGMALGVALAGVLFFAQLADDSAYGVDKVTPSLREQLTAAGIPPSEQDDIIAGFQDCVHDWSAATDPTEMPASCQSPPDQAGTPQANQLQELLTQAGDQANAHNFARTFAIALWYGFGMLILVFIGLFALPRQVRARDLDAELAAIEEQRVEAG